MDVVGQGECDTLGFGEDAVTVVIVTTVTVNVPAVANAPIDACLASAASLPLALETEAA
jgi:hypothetical protein